jgi:hypothetical protein
MFVDTAENTCKAARQLHELMTNYTSIREKVNSIEELNMNVTGTFIKS